MQQMGLSLLLWYTLGIVHKNQAALGRKEKLQGCRHTAQTVNDVSSILVYTRAASAYFASLCSQHSTGCRTAFQALTRWFIAPSLSALLGVAPEAITGSVCTVVAIPV